MAYCCPSTVPDGDPMDRSIPGFPALHYLPEFAQIPLFSNPMDVLNHVTNQGCLSAGFWGNQSHVFHKNAACLSRKACAV